MIFELSLVELLEHPVVELVLVHKLGQLYLNLVVELLEGELVPDFHLVAEGLNGDFQFSLVDHVRVDGLVVLLDIDLYLSEHLLDFDEIAGVLTLLLLRDHRLAEKELYGWCVWRPLRARWLIVQVLILGHIYLSLVPITFF